MEQYKNTILELCSKGGVAAVLLFILLYFGNSFLSSQQEMQKDLANIRVELAKIQATIIPPSQIEKMIDDKIKILEYHYHSKDTNK